MTSITTPTPDGCTPDDGAPHDGNGAEPSNVAFADPDPFHGPIHFPAALPTYKQLNALAVPAWPLKQRGLTTVLSRHEVRPSLIALHKRIYSGHETVTLSREDADFLRDLGALDSQYTLNRKVLAERLLEAGEPAGSLEGITMLNAVALLRTRAGRGNEEVRLDGEKRSEPAPAANPPREPKAGTAMAKALKMLREAEGGFVRIEPSSYVRDLRGRGWKIEAAQELLRNGADLPPETKGYRLRSS